MSDVHIVPSAAVEALRRKAKKLVRQDGIPHHAALDAVARAGGYPDWHHFIEAAKATEPTERAFKKGLVVGIDIKEAQDVPSSLNHFVRDEQLVMFVRFEFEREHPRPWSEETGWKWEELDELVYFRGVRSVPHTLDEAWKLTNEDFFFPPRYLRLRGQVEKLFPEDDGDA
jgi:hypothetical protein